MSLLVCSFRANLISKLSWGYLCCKQVSLCSTVHACLHASLASLVHVLLADHWRLAQGIALSSDPDYKVLAAAYPWIARRLITNTAPELRETLRNLLYKGGSFQFQRLESLLRQAALSPNRSKKGSQQQPAATKELVIENGEQAK